MIGKLLLALVAYEGIVQLHETAERHSYWRAAREYYDKVDKPLLRIGMRRSFLEPPNGDVTLDLDSTVQGIPGGVWGDERSMPFRNKEFGVCFNEHTLEHLRSAEDVQLAVNECTRVADTAVFLCPSPYSIYASVFCLNHNLRLWFDPSSNRIVVRENTWRSGFGHKAGISQALTAEGMPPMVIGRKSF